MLRVSGYKSRKITHGSPATRNLQQTQLKNLKNDSKRKKHFNS